MFKSTIFILALGALLILGGGVYVWQQRSSSAPALTPNTLPEVTEPTQSNNPETIDTSDWQTYRNEKYGFEFKLSDSYKFGIDGQNVSHVDNKYYYLDSSLRKYTFHSIEGTRILVEVAGKGDASDSWAIGTEVFDYSREFEGDFKGWVLKSHNSSDSDIESTGSIFLSDGRKANYFCWVSIGGNCSVFFTNKKTIIEFNTIGTTYLADGKVDYFSAILDSFHYYK